MWGLQLYASSYVKHCAECSERNGCDLCDYHIAELNNGKCSICRERVEGAERKTDGTQMANSAASAMTTSTLRRAINVKDAKIWFQAANSALKLICQETLCLLRSIGYSRELSVPLSSKRYSCCLYRPIAAMECTTYHEKSTNQQTNAMQILRRYVPRPLFARMLHLFRFFQMMVRLVKNVRMDSSSTETEKGDGQTNKCASCARFGKKFSEKTFPVKRAVPIMLPKKYV